MVEVRYRSQSQLLLIGFQGRRFLVSRLFTPQPINHVGTFRYLDSDITPFYKPHHLRNRVNPGIHPRTFNHASDCLRLFYCTYLHILSGISAVAPLFYFCFVLSWPRSWDYQHRVLFARNRFVARTGALSAHPTRYTGLHARNFPIYITTIFVQIPITKYNNRFRGVTRRQYFQQAGWIYSLG